MGKCSFGKISTKGAFAPRYPYGTDLYGRFIYLEGEKECALIAAFDFLGAFSSAANHYRKRLSELTGIPADSIWYHELQVHAAPEGAELSGEAMEELINRSAAEIKAMINRAEEYDCNVTVANVGTDYTMNREQYVEGLGGVTVWTGLRFDSEGTAYCMDSDVMLLRGYKPELPALKKPVYFDNPVDSLAYLFVFRNKSGEILGTMSRFAAHPDTAVLFELRVNNGQHYYDYDWPGYMTEELERRYNAPSLYLNGPCADLAVKKGYDGMDDYASSAAESKRIGEELAEVLVAAQAKSSEPVGDINSLHASTFYVRLPIRDDFPKSRQQANNLSQDAENAKKVFDEAIANGAPAYEVKKLCDLWWRKGVERALVYDICGFDDETLARGSVEVTVSAISLGDYLFLGVPGESLVDMTYWLRSTFSGQKTVTVDMVNGYFAYMATPRSLTLGGYTFWSSWVSHKSIPLLKEFISKVVPEFLNEK